MSIFENFEKKLQAEPKSIVFTEGTDARILSAASRLHRRSTPAAVEEEARAENGLRQNGENGRCPC